MMDVTLSFFVTLALFALILGIHKNSRFFLLWGLCIGISILIKSVLGFFPAVVSIIFIMLTKRWRVLLNPYFISGCIGIVVIGFSWYIHQFILFGNVFLKVHFGWLIFERGFKVQSETWYRSPIIRKRFNGLLLAMVASLYDRNLEIFEKNIA